jgi:hypothetical protein
MAKFVFAGQLVDLDDKADASALAALAARVAELENRPDTVGVQGLNGVAKLWAGTQAEYDALGGTPAADTVYLITSTP